MGLEIENTARPELGQQRLGSLVASMCVKGRVKENLCMYGVSGFRVQVQG
jgi:hypothetical protein